MELNKIYQGDCLEVMKTFKDGCIDLIITSPPYNKGYWSKNRNMNNGFKSFNHKNSTTIKTKCRRIEYGDFNDKLLPEEYEKQQRELLKECIRVIKPTGSIFYNHIDILSEHQTIHPKYVYDFPVKQIIIWNRKMTPKLDKSYFFPINEYIFWIQKDKKARTYFNRRNCKLQKNIWDINPEKNNNFPAPFPIEIPENCINACCPQNGIVLDPYMGSGTTAVASKNLNRNYIGIEISEEYCKIAEERINKLNF